MTYEININLDAPRCRVLAGVSRRAYISTPRLVGLALLGSRVEAAPEPSDTAWHDFLASHGVAVGTRGTHTTHVQVIPAGVRTVNLSGDARGGVAPATFNITFPPLVLTATFGTALMRSALFVADVTQQRTFSVIAAGQHLCPFPYGNVYEDGRICWGTVPVADIHTPNDLITAFFGSGFNGDLYRPLPGTASSLGATAMANATLPLPRFGSSVSAAIARVL